MIPCSAPQLLNVPMRAPRFTPIANTALNRKFLLNIAVLLFVNVLIKPFYIFGIDRTIQNTVGERAYGMYFSLLSFTLIFQIINDFGIQNFNNKNIAQHEHLLEKYFSNILVLKLLLTLVYALVVGLAGWLAGYSAEYTYLLALLTASQVLNSFVLFLRSNVSGLQRYYADSFLSVLDRLVLIVVCGALLWGGSWWSLGVFRVEWLVYAQIFAYLITAFTALWFLRDRLGLAHFTRLRLNRSFLLLLLRGSAPYALTVFLMSVYTRLDSVMIERLLPDGANEAGLYASAYRLLDASVMVGYLTASLLLPMFARLLKERAAVLPLVRLSFSVVWVLATTVAAGVWMYREPMMHLLYAHATPYSGALLGWLMWSFPAVVAMYIFGTLLTANGSMREMNILFVGSVVLNLALNLALIPEYKALGSAWATLATQAFVPLVQVLLCVRIFRWRTDVLFLVRTAAVALFAVGVFGGIMRVA